MTTSSTGPQHPARVRSALRAIAPIEAGSTLDRIRSVLCEPTRARIARALVVGQLTVGDLARVIRRSESATSQHLRVLRENGIVRRRRRGRLTYYSLAEDDVTGAVNHVLSQLR